jgi:molybdate transport system ATP-binding protein
MNHLSGEIVSVTEFGNRARVMLATPQPLVAEITAASVERLSLRPGGRATATWKATATRLSPRPS